MKTPREISLGDMKMPDPGRIAERKSRVLADLHEFRDGVKEWLPQKVRDTAKEIAVAQTDVTLRMPKEKMAGLKRAIDEYVGSLDQAIEEEFTPQRTVDTRDVSSGQIASLLERRVDAAIRRLLVGLNPILEKAGYRKDHLFFEKERDGLGLLERRVDLPGDLLNILRDVVDTLIELKADEAKIGVLDRKKARKLAEETWEKS